MTKFSLFQQKLENTKEARKKNKDEAYTSAIWNLLAGVLINFIGVCGFIYLQSSSSENKRDFAFLPSLILFPFSAQFIYYFLIDYQQFFSKPKDDLFPLNSDDDITFASNHLTEIENWFSQHLTETESNLEKTVMLWSEAAIKQENETKTHTPLNQWEPK